MRKQQQANSHKTITTALRYWERGGGPGFVSVQIVNGKWGRVVSAAANGKMDELMMQKTHYSFGDVWLLAAAVAIAAVASIVAALPPLVPTGIEIGKLASVDK